eukprot:TRINITY_DN4519_c0_g1_i1.p5 TRINITY_DN4519_c0_g1~~TRINITY_DN4519_c0_g1_i1.p5  ORF type:complete len:73 (+),score=17.31 TRINITY_DN4519_c0_g1_i1:213-431(+)
MLARLYEKADIKQSKFYAMSVSLDYCDNDQRVFVDADTCYNFLGDGVPEDYKWKMLEDDKICSDPVCGLLEA